jgi:hypothetical protein
VGIFRGEGGKKHFTGTTRGPLGSTRNSLTNRNTTQSIGSIGPIGSIGSLDCQNHRHPPSRTPQTPPGTPGISWVYPSLQNPIEAGKELAVRRNPAGATVVPPDPACHWDTRNRREPLRTMSHSAQAGWGWEWVVSSGSLGSQGGSGITGTPCPTRTSEFP